MQNFVPNEAMVNLYSLRDAANLYNKTMLLWKNCSTLFPFQVHYVRYENVISNLRDESQKLASFLNLSWNKSMVKYQRTVKNYKGKIRTPSYNQVSEKLYSQSVYRWKKYNKYMNSILPIINPWIKYWNYEN